MDSVMEKMGIYELFTVFGAGMLSCTIWYCAAGLPKIKYLDSEHSSIIVLGVLTFCYMIGMILQEYSSILDRKYFKFREKACKLFLNDDNKIIENIEELKRFRKVWEKTLNKADNNFQSNEAELFFNIAKTYLERNVDNSNISRINSIYGMSRSLFISIILTIAITIFTGVLWNPQFKIMECIFFKIFLCIVEFSIGILFLYRAKKYAEIKVRTIMKYYADAMEESDCN